MAIQFSIVRLCSAYIETGSSALDINCIKIILVMSVCLCMHCAHTQLIESRITANNKFILHTYKIATHWLDIEWDEPNIKKNITWRLALFNVRFNSCSLFSFFFCSTIALYYFSFYSALCTANNTNFVSLLCF